MARRRVSFKVAPGVRISASSRGIRTSIGNNSGRVSFGAGGLYTSAKVAGVRVSQRHSSGVKTASSATARKATSSSRASIAQLERAQKAAALESQIAELNRIERALTTLHLEDFAPAGPFRVVPPLPTDVEELSAQWQREATKNLSFFKRSARRLAETAADQAARAEAIRSTR